ncbi:MAG TPA: rod shape-determining protein RodA [Candidatus Paceibacterota bacterium]|nr:rod shape-determining protein RodA [Candidatus Paceibacterota bacterium]HOL54076.1 rod shape-determining protein RodA [Candidatus Paceibacterota bacterium]HON21734.1 rod shape-determining protein RodA [Candidatus Paceibacterota bacterium]HPP17169.1 rod shape-determining protein RodA [Candidatus Paceibacterota bacterium]
MSKTWKQLSFSLIAPVILLSFFSLLTLYSLSLQDPEPLQFFKKQAFWFIFCFAIFYIITRFFDYRIFNTQNFFVVGLYLLALILLIAVLLVGPKIKGTTGWLNFKLFSFQPVELAKLALVILLARYFANWHVEIWRPRHLLVTAVYTGIYAFLAFLQPDMGAAVFFILIWLGMLLVSGLKFKHFVILLIVFIILSLVGWQYFLQPYQKERILTFLNPDRDPLGSGYSVSQAKIAVGSAGLFGKGLGQGLLTQLHFLPEAKTDFFFAAFVEEWGLIGALVLFLIYGWLFFQIYHIGLKSENNFSRLVCFGYLLTLVVQILLNLGANLGFLPVTGLPLPFLSYGGSNLLINFIALGIIQNIKNIHQK